MKSPAAFIPISKASLQRICAHYCLYPQSRGRRKWERDTFLREICPLLSGMNLRQQVQVHILLTVSGFCHDGFYRSTYCFFSLTCTLLYSRHFVQLILTIHILPVDLARGIHTNFPCDGSPIL